MDYSINISASAASHAGTTEKINQNNFYINGRFMQDYETSSVQVSVDGMGDEFLFAVSSKMDREMPDVGTSISAMRELRRFHERMKGGSKEAKQKFEQLCENIEETGNLAYSIHLGSGEMDKKPEFAGLFISENNAYSVGIGNSRVYLLRDGNVRQIVSDAKKTERLLKMGILTHEQASMLSGKYGSADKKGISELRKTDAGGLKPGDTFLLCSSGLPDSVNEERIFELLADQRESSQIAGSLIKESLKNGSENNVTALVVKVAGGKSTKSDDDNDEKVRTYRYSRPERRDSSGYRPQAVRRKSRRASMMTRRIISTTVMFLIVAGSIYGLYKLWSGIGKEDLSDSAALPIENQQVGKQQETEEQELVNTGDYEGTGGDEKDYDNMAAEDGPENGKNISYTVVKGDSLYSISKHFYNDPEKYKLIMEANGIENPDYIMAGQILIIPDITSP